MQNTSPLQWLVLIAMCPTIGLAQDFSVESCIRTWTIGVDQKYRMPLARAQAKCQADGKAIDAQRRLLIGSWRYYDKELAYWRRITFHPDGSAQITRFNYGSKRVETTTERWEISDVGRLSGIYGYVISFQVVGNQMTFIHAPTSTINAFEEIWQRIP